VVLIPYTTARERLSGFSFISQILGSTTSTAVIPEAIQEITLLMRDAHSLNGGAMPDDFTIRDQTAIAAAATSTTSVMTGLLAAIASISLVVGGIGIMNIMLVSVTERTREIGIRMAIGARGFDVLFQFLTEAVMVCFIGGLAGVALGIGGGLATSAIAGWRVIFTVGPILLSFACAFLTGIVFGYLPARKAARLDPIEALARD